MMKSSVHTEEDDFVPELQRSIHPRERPDWEETLSAMARGADIPDIPGELPLRTCGSTASMKVKNVKKLSFTKGHFPKMAECAHFHYENVDFGNIQLSLPEEQNEVTRNGCESKELVYLVQISCQGRSWIVKRSYEDFRVLDKHLHLCIYDRRFSQLSELPRSDALRDSPELVTQMLMAYLSRLSAIAGNKINCGPALTWMEIDNKGNHLLVHEESSINVPAIAAAHVIKRYIAQAADELSFEVGDIVSVIDMPPKELTTWWRGKHGFQVGFFPSECVELINDKVPQSVTNSVPKPVSKKHGKLITFLRTFMKSRPTKQKLKQRGILKERVFGCDLGEHLLNSGHDVPQVLKSCTEFIEKHGIVDGIYRLSGIASNIQKLRHEFDSEQIPDLTKDIYIQDIHCVGSLCKLYFRELPNPLLTYQLYEKFSDAVSAATDEERLVKIHDVIQQLPPPHYRTLEFLMRHLARLADYCSITNMHTKNLAIVWAPNLLRSKQIESACFSGTAAFMEVRIQSVVVEFILNHVDVLFSSKLSSVIRDGAGHSSLSRPKSLLVSSPSTKLLTLEEAQARTQAQINSPIVADSKYIEVGEGPAALQGKFHTVIDFPSERKRPPSKMKKSPVGSWRSFFNLGKSSSVSKRKLQRNPSEPSEMKAIALAGGRGDSGTLRSAKSEESLTSLHAVDGEPKLFRPRRPRSSSDALSASFNGELLGNIRCNSYDNLPHEDSDGDEGLIHVPALISPRSAEDVDLSPPDIGVASLDFDPMSFQCSPPQAESECLDSSTSLLESVGINKEKPSLLKKDLESGSQSQTPGSATSSEPVSPFQEKMSPFFTLDLSPTEEKACKPPTFSPKLGRKPIKSPPTAAEPVSFVLPSRMSEGIGGVSITSRNSSASSWSKGTGITEITNRSPTQMSLPLKNSESEAGEGAHQELQHAQLLAAGKPELPEEGERPMSSSQNKTVPTGHTQPGAVALDSPQDPVPVSSVSLIPPPPPKNAARMLALALAESAQQASAQAQKRPGDAPSESTNYGETEAGTALEKLHLSAGAPDKLHHYTALPENRLHFQPGAPVEQDFQGSSTPGEQNHPPGAPGNRDPPPLHTGMPGDMPGSRDAEQEQSSFHPGQAGDKDPFPCHAGDWEHTAQHPAGVLPDWEPPAADVSVDKPHLRACVSGDKHQVWGTTTPEKPPEPAPGFVPESTCSSRCSSSPAPVHQYRPESVPPHLSYHSKPDQHQAYPPRSETPASAGTRYNTYTTQGKSSSALHSKPRSRTEFVSSVSPTGPRNASYTEEAPPYPTIRRVQSLHVPTPAASTIRSVPISRTEVPPDDEPVYCPRPLYQYKPYQPHSDYHVTQLQPYFENGRVHYRYSPYSSSSGSSYYTTADGGFYDLDPYSTVRVRPFHPLPTRDFPAYASRLQSKGLYRYPSLSAYPRGGLIGHLAGKEHSFVSRDVPPAPDVKHMYMSWDLEDMEKFRMQSIRRESRTRQKVKGPLMSQYDNVAPLLPEELGGLDVIHLRSKSDPGKTGLLTVAEGKEGRYPAKAGTPEGDERYYVQHPEPEPDRAHYHGAYGNGQAEKPSLPQKQSSIRSRKLHEPGCSTAEHRTHLQQEASHRQPSEPKNGPPYPDYRPKGGPEPSEPIGYQHSGGKYIPANQDTLRLNHKEMRLAEDRADLERSRARPTTSMEKHSRDCYKEEEHAASPMAPPPKPERSHSLRMQHPESMERDSALLYPYQTLGKRQSTMTVVSQYDNLEDYHTMPQHQRGGYVGGGGFVPPSFTHVHSRTYATALGQGAFLPTELCLQRPETEVHVE
ncbi:PREDICTED: rho GTPase-activating protein 32 [Chaetura pelagica]|uniref:rho GTPase-activating protein 32 n=1 Tax=Chaetura pelagica TaxID=8897 RepID=UPI000523B10B|nr:PREDICTED: rho GTPase-activating protein 32 [Chaetura pelagica]